MFVRSIVIPILAVTGVGVAIYTVRTENKPVIPAPPVTAPATSPFEEPVAGAGIIEASTQNIAIGTHIAGIVATVHVKVGDSVKAGDPLFTIDERTLKAELAVRSAALEISEKTLGRLRSLPRKEDVPPLEARVNEAKTLLGQSQMQVDLVANLQDPRAVSTEERDRRTFTLSATRSRLVLAEADLALLKAGAWASDLEIAQAQIDSARAQMDSAKTEIERLTVKAPTDGQLLQVNTRMGEFAQAGVMAQPLMLFGNTDTLHVRVDIDENDAWRVRADAKAFAYVRGNKELKTELAFVRIEPYVIPKRSLTGDSVERVDTRVLQVLYSFPRGKLPVYVGQQMDVFIDAPRTKGTAG